MSKIGQLALSSDEEYEFVGELLTMNLDISISLVPNHDHRKPDSPNYHVYGQGRLQNMAQIGAAWVQTTTRGEGMETEYLSLTLDDPCFPDPLKAAAFPNEELGLWEIVWRRDEA